MGNTQRKREIVMLLRGLGVVILLNFIFHEPWGLLALVILVIIGGFIADMQSHKESKASGANEIAKLKPYEITPPAQSDAMPPPPASAEGAHRFDLLLPYCSQCGSPARPEHVKWTGPKSAECAYCGAKLRMTKG